MEAFKIRAGSALIFLLFIGCASVKTGQEWAKFQEITKERTGQELLWEKSEEEQAVIRKEVDELLTDGLSRQEAVRVALLNNRLLQSTFEELGISKSDLVQAGLLSNPSLSAVFRFLISSGSGTNIDADMFFPISDLWQITFRKKAAAAQMEATTMRVGQMVIDTVAEAKHAYDAVYYLIEARKETEEMLDRFTAIRDQVVIRRDFGYMSDLDVYLAQTMVAEAEMELARFEGELAIASSRFNRVLALGLRQIGYEIRGGAVEELVQLPALQEAVEYALDRRLDIQMARFKVQQVERTLELELKKNKISYSVEMALMSSARALTSSCPSSIRIRPRLQKPDTGSGRPGKTFKPWRGKSGKRLPAIWSESISTKCGSRPFGKRSFLFGRKP